MTTKPPVKATGFDKPRADRDEILMHIRQEDSERHVLSVTVDNEAGILARIAGMVSARGYNIESLTVADVSEDHKVSRITIVTHGPPRVIDQIIAQLERLVPVHQVTDLTEAGPFVERELALVKVAGSGDMRNEALRLADVFRAKVVDTTLESFIFEITGPTSKIDTFVGLMRELGLVDLGRTGVVGMSRGADA
jgi:acetolactate synthase-1/3 small subunit